MTAYSPSSSPSVSIFHPLLPMVLLSFLVLFRLVQVRGVEIKTRIKDIQRVATSKGKEQWFEDTRAADNWKNLCEVPIFFYLVLVVAFVTNTKPTAFFTLLSWTFVVLRYAHSAIQLTINLVFPRFFAFILSTIVCAIMWIWLGMQLWARD